MAENITEFPKRSKVIMIPGPAGQIECLTAPPEADAVDKNRVALICHPHPLYGGTMRNKVTHMLEKAFRDMGAHTVRFNFRGVGESSGVFDDGVGEAEDLMARVFGESIRDIRFFRSEMRNYGGKEMLVARSGWSKQGGFEVYVNDIALGLQLWDELFEKGADLDVGPGCPNNIERIESGLMSFGNDMDYKDGEDFYNRNIVEYIRTQG